MSQTVGSIRRKMALLVSAQVSAIHMTQRELQRRKPWWGITTLSTASTIIGPIPIRVLSRTSRLVRVPVNQWGMVGYSSTVRSEAKHSGLGRYCGRGHGTLAQGLACAPLTAAAGRQPGPAGRATLPTRAPRPAQPALIDRLQAGYRSLLLRLLLAALSGLMLCVPWLNNQLFWSGWLGWVPLLYALRGAGPGMGLLLGWVAGTLCFAGG